MISLEVRRVACVRLFGLPIWRFRDAIMGRFIFATGRSSRDGMCGGCCRWGPSYVRELLIYERKGNSNNPHTVIHWIFCSILINDGWQTKAAQPRTLDVRIGGLYVQARWPTWLPEC